MAKLITLGALIDTTISHYTKHFRELAGISLWLVVGTAPFLFANFLAPFGVDATTPPGELYAYLGLNVVGFIVTTLVSLWVGITLIYTIAARAQGTTPNHTALGRRAWKSVPSFLVLSIAISFGFLLAVLCMFIPGLVVLLFNSAEGGVGIALGVLGTLLLFGGIVGSLYVLIRFGVELAFTQYTLLLENDATSFSWTMLQKAVRSSRAAVKGSWWGVMIRLFVPNALFSLLVVAVTIAVNLVTTLLLALAAGWLSALAIQLVSVIVALCITVVSALVLPLYSLATYLLYDSAKTS